MQKTPMTILGAQALKNELDELKHKRPEISAAIAEARAHGDLRENAEYHAAKEQQGLMEARVRDIEAKLANAQIIDVATIADTSRVVFGATVHLQNVNTEEEIRYQIVGDDEANFKDGKISINTPIARALIGKEIDDITEVITPSGVVEYEIIKIEYV